VLEQLERKPRLLVPPPKKWRNIYEVNCAGIEAPGLGFFLLGEIFKGNTVWPSKDIAEQKALEFITDPMWTPKIEPGDIIYHGAFEEQ